MFTYVNYSLAKLLSNDVVFALYRINASVDVTDSFPGILGQCAAGSGDGGHLTASVHLDPASSSSGACR